MKGLIIIILIIASGFAAIYFLPEDVLDKTENIPKTEVPEVLDVGGETLEEDITPISTDSGGGGATSESSEGGGATQTFNPDCSNKQVSYSLKSFNEDVVCNTYGLSGCVDLEVTCSVRVFNLDESTTGDFEVGFDLLDSTTREIILSLTEEKSLGPKEDDLFEGFFTIQDEDGLDEEGYDCDFTTLSIPNKLGC